jgi:hypothetical protein
VRRTVIDGVGDGIERTAVAGLSMCDESGHGWLVVVVVVMVVVRKRREGI